jgi:hypothetical protein
MNFNIEPFDPKSNYIRAGVAADRARALISMHIEGLLSAWISYDAEQLDELIRILQCARADMLPLPLELSSRSAR